MKRLFSILMALILLTGAVFADENEGDEYIDDYIYDSNGAGDQFLKLNLGVYIPLDFGGNVKKADGKLYTGGDVNAGYYKFLNNWLALGFELTASYNISVGNKILVTLPLCFGVLTQPSIGNFEFPFYFTIGAAYETWQNIDNFPSLSLGASGGVFYRFTESFSLGLSCSYIFIQQWVKNGKDIAVNNNQGQFLGINLGARYHF